MGNRSTVLVFLACCTIPACVSAAQSLVAPATQPALSQIPTTIPSAAAPRKDSKLPANWENLSLTKLANAARAFYAVHGQCSECASLRAELAKHVWVIYLSSDAGLQAAARTDAHSLLLLIQLSGNAMTPEMRRSASKRFHTILLTDAAINQMSLDDVVQVQQALVGLRDPPVGRLGVLNVWLETQSHLDRLTLENLVYLSSYIPWSQANALHVWKLLSDEAWSTGLNPQKNQGRPIDLIRTGTAILAFSAQFNTEQQTELLAELVDRLDTQRDDLGKIPLSELPIVIRALRQLHATDIQVVDVLSRWAHLRDQEPTAVLADVDSAYETYVIPELLEVNTSKAKSVDELLRSRLNNGSTSWGSDSIEFLTAIAVSKEGKDSWVTQLENRLKAPSTKGDERAGIFLARALAERWGQVAPTTAKGEVWAQQALAVASSTRMQLVCTLWIARYESLDFNLARARHVIAQARSQATDPRVIATLDAAAQDVDQRAQGVAAYQQQLADQQDLVHLQGQLKSLQTRLALAQAHVMPPQVIDVLRSLVDNTQAELVTKKKELDLP